MKRDVSTLQQGAVDVLIVGGGIYGSWLAYHTATAGYKVALIERSDWGSATSSASSKLLHGGLRYLERLEIGLVRKSLHERRELNRLLPHHVRPLRFLLPVYRDSRVARWRLKVGLWLYDRLAGKGQPVGGHTSFTAQQLCEQEPALRSQDLLGGFSYGDCGTDDARMILEIVDSAIQAGAAACNGVSAQHLLVNGDHVIGATLCDEHTGQTFDLQASVVVNAAGPWVFSQFDLESERPRLRLTRGVHLVMPGLSEHAVLLTARSDGRVFFLIPWYGRTLLGTTDTDFNGDPSTVRVEPQDVDYLLQAANDYLNTGWTTDDICATYCGLRTLQNEVGKTASGVSREWTIEPSRPGLLTSIGGKYTSARVDTIEAFHRVRAMLPDHSRALPEPQPLAWHPSSDFATFQHQMIERAMSLGIDRDTAATATRRFGSRMCEILTRVEDAPELAGRIVPELPFCRAEVMHAVQQEMAHSLVDVLRRRIPILLLTRLSRTTIREIADLAATAAGWDAVRIQQEIDSVDAVQSADAVE
ncbi:MAG: glycerol-3-phosphate dehydrogenase/oxidase [Planctomycetaceae bacterium]